MKTVQCLDVLTLDALVAPGPRPGPAHHVGDEDHDDHGGEGAAHDDGHHVVGPVAAVRGGLELATGDAHRPERVEPDVCGGERGVGQLLPGVEGML